MISEIEIAPEVGKKTPRLRKFAFPVSTILLVAGALGGGAYFANRDNVTAPFDEFRKSGAMNVFKSTLTTKPTLKEILGAKPITGYQDGRKRCGLKFNDPRRSVSFETPELFENMGCSDLRDPMVKGAKKYFGIENQ